MHRVTSLEPLLLDCNSIIITVVHDQSVDKDKQAAGKIVVKGVEPVLKPMTQLESYLKICSGFVIQQLIKSLDKVSQQQMSMEHISEQTMLALESVLQSNVFENGFIKQTYIQIEKQFESEEAMQTSLQSKEKVCGQHYKGLLSSLQFDGIMIGRYDSLCKDLQDDCAKKLRQSILMGELGQTLCKSAFLAVLKHSLKLEDIVSKLQTQDSVEATNDLKKLWYLCAKVRVICKDYETDKQFEDYFKKIAIILSIDPSLSLDSSPTSFASPQKYQFDQGMNEGVMKMKMYIESLRLNSSSPNQKGPNPTVETITRFLGIIVTSAQLITIIDLRSQ